MNLNSFINKINTYIKNKVFAKYYSLMIFKKTRLKIKNYKDFIKGLSCPKNEKYQLNFVSGFNLECEKNDLNAIGETCVLEDYQKYKDIKIKKGDLVFDVGAHIGSFSIYAANKGAIVYAFEPDKENFKKLITNIKLNQFEGCVKPFNYGIYKFTGEIDLNLSFSNKAGHSILTDNYLEKFSIKVKKLEDVFKELDISKVNLFKIDIEGAEYEIFENFNSYEAGVIEKIIGEYHLLPEKNRWNFSYIKFLLKPYYKKIKKFFPYYFYCVK